MKHNILFWVVPFAVLISASFALAEDGCFTYADSPLYCKTISIEEAQDECSLYEDCTLEAAFSSGTCDDTSAFPSCQKVLCKSSCSETFVEECSAGIIPEEEQAEWCSPGCCKFSYSEGDFCEYKPSKWLCEVEAKNKNIVQFNFGISDEEQCADSCATATSPLEKENVPIKPSTKNISQTNLTDTNETETNSSGLGWFLVFLLVVIVGGIIFYYRKLISFNLSKLSPEPEEELEDVTRPPKPEDDDSFSKTLWKYLIKERLKPLTAKYGRKVKIKQREEFLMETGLTVEKAPETIFTKLKKLSRKNKHAEPAPKPKPEKKALERLNELTAKPSAKSGSAEIPLTSTKPSSKRNEALEELKKVAKGK
ncbi:hypothetical protein HZC30_00435 [Candidatus Woesearchaeota archaeon]|nr:hypothetical protein [Candidatus Woesearchaeota archaeon]